ncbi:hypothetical protein [Mucilaginibacter antarcticus]|uniref:DUF4292 domain-containing protein n=1 Tax=Mucilaginibacter antarcticus TaxID=1855725 RepID=A0ABW5XSV3_9SPHI
MVKALLILILTCVASVSFAQQNDSYYGMVITKVTNDGSSGDTSKLLYCRNKSGSLLSVYTVRGRIVAVGTAYSIKAGKDGLYFYSRPKLSTPLTTDSLRIDFKDTEHIILINKHDSYSLYPAYYTRFKQEVASNHSVIALLGLLEDGIGDYPIEDALPLIGYTPQLDQHIQQAKVMTQRSQSDLIDTWICTYRYNKSHKLTAISAVDGELSRFTKKIIYNGAKASSIQLYLNIEDRQVTDRTISYDRKDRLSLKWKERVLETGKNRETGLSTSFYWHDLGMFLKIDPSPAEILYTLRPATKNGITKSYPD